MDKILNLISGLDGNFRSRVFAGTILTTLVVLIHSLFYDIDIQLMIQLNSFAVFISLFGFILIYSAGVLVEFYGKSHIYRLSGFYPKFRKLSNTQKTHYRAIVMLKNRRQLKSNFLGRLILNVNIVRSKNTIIRSIFPLKIIIKVTMHLDPKFRNIVSSLRDNYSSDEFYTKMGEKYYNRLDRNMKCALEDVFSVRHLSALDMLDKYLTDEQRSILRRYRSNSNDFVMTLSSLIISTYILIMYVMLYLFSKYLTEITRIVEYINIFSTPNTDQDSEEILFDIALGANAAIYVVSAIIIVIFVYRTYFGIFLYEFYKTNRKSAVLLVEMLAN